LTVADSNRIDGDPFFHKTFFFFSPLPLCLLLEGYTSPTETYRGAVALTGVVFCGILAFSPRLFSAAFLKTWLLRDVFRRRHATLFSSSLLFTLIFFCLAPERLSLTRPNAAAVAIPFAIVADPPFLSQTLFPLFSSQHQFPLRLFCQGLRHFPSADRIPFRGTSLPGSSFMCPNPVPPLVSPLPHGARAHPLDSSVFPPFFFVYFFPGGFLLGLWPPGPLLLYPSSTGLRPFFLRPSALWWRSLSSSLEAALPLFLLQTILPPI